MASLASSNNVKCGWLSREVYSNGRACAFSADLYLLWSCAWIAAVIIWFGGFRRLIKAAL